MQLIYPALLPLLSLVPLATAAGTCTSSGALSWPPVGDCSKPLKFDLLTQNCRACCLNDQPCFTACLKAGGGLSKRDSFDEKSYGVMPERRNLRSRAIALNCEKNENCYKYTDGSLLCLSLGTGLYHDDVGGNGDFFSGKYTGPDGRVQTGTGAPASTAAATSRRQSSSPTAQMTGSAALSQSSSAGATSAGAARASGSTGAAAATSSSGSERLYLGAHLGLVGLAARLVL